MRIISGTHRSRKLLSPEDEAIRPTGDRVRQAVFNMLEHAPWMEGQSRDTVLDAFCGTGAMGLEALSRWAKRVTFMDNNRVSLALAKQNAESLREEANCTFIQADATAPPPAPYAFDIVFLDPPYGNGLSRKAIEALTSMGWISASTIIVEEIARTDSYVLALSDNLKLLDTRTYGNTVVNFLELA